MTPMKEPQMMAGPEPSPTPPNHGGQNSGWIIALSVTLGVVLVVGLAGALFWKYKKSTQVNPDTVYDKNGVTVMMSN